MLRVKRWKLCLLHCKRQQCSVLAFEGDFVDLGPSGAADFGGALLLLPHSILILLYTVDKHLVLHTFTSTRSVHMISTRGLLESGILEDLYWRNVVVYLEWLTPITLPAVRLIQYLLYI